VRNKVHYLLATGPTGTEIPSLNIKVIEIIFIKSFLEKYPEYSDAKFDFLTLNSVQVN
jgi:hypothetical protein